jgi:hypothetical protein
MKGLTTGLFGQACRIFLTIAYPEGEQVIPPAKHAYLDISPDQPLDKYLTPPVCQPLKNPDGSPRGYALRLGSSNYPHLKMQVIDCDASGTWVFSVDTHDAMRLEPGHPEAERWAQVQEGNRRLKEQIERAWDGAGVLTFNGLLRRGLGEQ